MLIITVMYAYPIINTLYNYIAYRQYLYNLCHADGAKSE